MASENRRKRNPSHSAWGVFDHQLNDETVDQPMKCWESEFRKSISTRTVQHTTTCYFSALTVTRIFKPPSKKKLIISKGDLIRQKRSFSNQIPLQHPQFMSPLMSGHVSGLANSKSVKLAKIRKHRFIHDALIAERSKFMTALRQARMKQRIIEMMAALKIQRLWRIYYKFIARAREVRRKITVKVQSPVYKSLIKLLRQDPRCSEWAFNIAERRQMDMNAQSSAEHVIQGTLRSRAQRLKTAQSRQQSNFSNDSDESETSFVDPSKLRAKSYPEKGYLTKKVGEDRRHRCHSDETSNTTRKSTVRPITLSGHSQSLLNAKLDVSAFKEVVSNSFDQREHRHHRHHGHHSHHSSVDTSSHHHHHHHSPHHHDHLDAGLRDKLAEEIALRKLEDSIEMIEARKMEEEANKPKVKQKLVMTTTGLFSKQLVLKEVPTSK